MEGQGRGEAQGVADSKKWPKRFNKIDCRPLGPGLPDTPKASDVLLGAVGKESFLFQSELFYLSRGRDCID
jgi:hypothetical protein